MNEKQQNKMALAKINPKKQKFYKNPRFQSSFTKTSRPLRAVLLYTFHAKEAQY